MSSPLRLVHLSDIHVWRIPANLLHLFNKRILGVIDLARGRARKFRLERLDEVVARVQQLAPDHVLITGDLTTTALTSEFVAALDALAPLLTDPARVSMIPGNHDRYTRSSMRNRKFEQHFGPYMPAPEFPWTRWLDDQTAILGLDATRSHISARGYLRPDQMKKAGALLDQHSATLKRLLVACHYPAVAPPGFERELAIKRLKNEAAVRDWLATLPPHLLCCGHVHAAWAFTPPSLPRELCLNAGAPLLRDKRKRRLPGFLLIELDGEAVSVQHHAWTDHGWQVFPMVTDMPLFASGPPTAEAPFRVSPG